MIKISCLRGRGVDGPVRERACRQHRAQQQLADRQSQRAQRLLRALPPCPSHARSSPNGATCPCRHSQGTRHLVYKAIEQMKRSLEPSAHGQRGSARLRGSRLLPAMRFPHGIAHRDGDRSHAIHDALGGARARTSPLRIASVAAVLLTLVVLLLWAGLALIVRGPILAINAGRVRSHAAWRS